MEAKRPKIESATFRQFTNGELTRYRPLLLALLAESCGMPEDSEPVLTQYSHLLSGHGQGWGVLAVVNGRTAPAGIVVTRLVDDRIWRHRTLWIDVLNVYPGLPAALWEGALAQLELFALENGASRIEGVVVATEVLNRLRGKFRETGTLVVREL